MESLLNQVAQWPPLLVNIVRLSVWLAVLSVVLVPLERLFAVRPGRVLRPQWGLDVAYYFINSLAPAWLMSVPLSIVGAVAVRWVPDAVPNTLSALPLPLRLLLTLGVAELGFYWAHRLCHQVPWLWRFHAIHHSAPRVDFLVNTHAHPVDMALNRLLGMVPLYLLGLAGPSASGSAAPLAVVLTGSLWGFFIHANVRWRFGPLEGLIATPAFHHWHHSRVDHINHNYASMLPVFDRVFGTHYLPRHWPSEYGVSEPLPTSLSGQLLAPFVPAQAPASPTPPAA